MDTNWSPFEDLIADDEETDETNQEVPVYGWRILCTLDEQGERWYRWSLTGDPELQETVATFERIKFVLQAHEYEHNGSHGHS